MKKILVFGDSHIAQLSTAYKQFPDNKKCHLEFVTGPGPISKKFKFKKNFLYLLPNDKNWPDTSNNSKLNADTFNSWYENTQTRFLAVSNQNPLDLCKFDAILIYGGDIIFNEWWKLANNYGYFSKALMVDLLISKISNTYHCNWLYQLQEFIADGGKVYSMLPPLLNELAFGTVEDSAQDLSSLKKMPDYANFRDVEPYYKSAIASFGAHFIQLPDHLYAQGFRGTSLKYKSTNERDFGHLNVEGGTLVLDNLNTILLTETRD